MLTGRHLVDIQASAVFAHEVLEQHMGVFQFFLEFLPAMLGVLAKHGQGALVFAGSHQFDVDLVLAQQAMEIGDLCHHADGAQHRKRRCDNAIGDAGHHVSTAGRNAVHTHGEPHALATDALELRGRQAVGMDQATRAFQPHHDLILFVSNLQ